METQAPIKIYTVVELNTEVQNYLKQQYPATIWVQGEIKNYDRNAHRNHIFFELCEKNPDNEQVLAKITAVIFNGVKQRLANSLRKINAGFQLRDDIEVKFECRVDLYPASGSYQLKVVDMDPYYTLGKIAQQRQAILEALKKEGLLEKNKMLLLPLVPLKVGLITSYNSAAYHDFLKELAESRYGFRVFHVDARMQGQQVEQDVCRAIELFNRQPMDVIVIIRGGGSRSDMSWFDNLKIARAIAHSGLPVFTGLGHEIDFSVSDLVAHTYQKTPTAAARYLTELVKNYLEKLDRHGSEIVERSIFLIRHGDQQLNELEKEAIHSARGLVNEARQVLQNAAWRIRQSHNRLIRQTLLRMESASQRIRLKMALWMRDSSKGIGQFRQLFPKLLESRFKNARSRLEIFSIRRNAADPIQVLKRGYTLSLDSKGRTIRQLSGVRMGDVLTTVFVDGQARSRVTEKRRLEGSHER
jgi:exodeoxyribonuclease VII large subunit